MKAGSSPRILESSLHVPHGATEIQGDLGIHGSTDMVWGVGGGLGNSFFRIHFNYVKLI